MARLSFSELVKVISEHPDFEEFWEAGVEPEKALYIVFEAGHRVESETFEAVDGSLVVLDRNADGQVCGIEIT
jgi:uncharacterized protein DUF2283